MRTKWNKIELDDLIVVIETDLNISKEGLNALGELVRRYRELEGKYNSVCDQIELELILGETDE